MSKTNDFSECSAVLGTLTSAQRAQRTLAAAAIPSRIIKLPPVAARRGCVWGIELCCNQRQNVETVLGAARISVREWRDDIPR